MNLYTQCANRLKQLRRESGLSQEVLAKKLRISRSCLANYESGKRQPDYATLIHIADHFNVLTDYLICHINLRSLEPEAAETALYLQNYFSRQSFILDLSVFTPQNQMLILHYYHFLTAKIPHQ
ncbi:MAG: helix-turn-helix transcriptional regulator [Ruminococcaceae bacterium]|nr:helix-turn-helix transcriptional regulator [Oscillospiraceae bacterium]